MSDYQNIPTELRTLRQWVCWRTETRNGKPTKVLKNPATHCNAAVDKSETWGTFEDALGAYNSNRAPQFDGIGFVFTKNDPYTGIDFDKCRDLRTGIIEPWALKLIRELDSYTELSPSETGLHTITRSNLAGKQNKKGHLEMYDHLRFFTMTGSLVAGIGRDTIEQRDLRSIEERFVLGKLGPQSRKEGVKRAEQRDETESGEDWRLLGDLVKEIGATNADAVEAVLRGRHSERYQQRNHLKGDHAGKTYWRYTIERWFERRQKEADSATTAAEKAIAALEADKKADPMPAIKHLTNVTDPAQRELLISRVAALKRPGLNTEFIKRQVSQHQDETEAVRKKAAATIEHRRLLALAARICGAKLLDQICRFIRRFVLLSKEQADVIALWSVHTHAFDAAEHTPYLDINSPEKRSGKSRLLEVLETLVARPWLTGRASVAALPRKIESEQPTVLLDEGDAAFNGDKEYAEVLRGILNTGHRRGGASTVCIKIDGNWIPHDFSTFSPKAIAGIGKLPSTVADRSIPIRMKRKSKGEKVSRFRLRDEKVKSEAAQLREQLAAYCAANIEKLRDARPELPDALSDRQQDGAEPLLAIADLAGGEWPEKARRAVAGLCADPEAKDDSVGVRLLSDIRAIFEASEEDRMPSADLAKALAEKETSPWGEWSHGKPITQSKLADLLRNHGITPGTIRISNDDTAKGYYREHFADAWSRYLPQNSPSETPQTLKAPTSNRHNVTTCTNTSENVNFGNVTPASCDGRESPQNPSKNEPCDVVTVSGREEKRDGGVEDEF
jgi:hypothetical protein